ncbi:MAG: hypothetical protein ACRCY3_08150 [Sphingorhabdus sp.]
MEKAGFIGMGIGLAAVGVAIAMLISRKTDYVEVPGTIVEITQKCYYTGIIKRKDINSTNFVPSDERSCGGLEPVPGYAEPYRTARFLFVRTRYQSPIDGQIHEFVSRNSAAAIHEPIRPGSRITVGAHKSVLDEAIVKRWK